jgi:hypothetical protein
MKRMKRRIVMSQLQGSDPVFGFGDCFDNPCRQVSVLVRLRQMLLGGTDQVAHAVRSTWDSDLPCDPAVDHGRIGPETTGSHPQQLDLSCFIPPCHPPPSSPVAHFLQRMAALAVDLRCEPRNTRNTRKNACLDVQVVVHDRETAGTR